MKKIAILGFGSVGKKFAKVFSRAGYDVVIGLRSPSAEAVSAEQNIGYPVAEFSAAAEQADAVALAIPYNIVNEILVSLKSELSGKIVIENTNPLNDDWSPLLLGQETSAAEEIAKLLPGSHVVKAFNTIFADVMECAQLEDKSLTAFVASDHQPAKDKVLKLAAAIGYSPLDVGPLSCARYLEAMAHLNIQIAVGMQGGTNAAFCYLTK